MAFKGSPPFTRKPPWPIYIFLLLGGSALFSVIIPTFVSSDNTSRSLKAITDILPTSSQKPIGICFFGLTRSLRSTNDNIQTNIFDVLKSQNIKYKIYLHTYDLKVLNAARSNELEVALDQTEWQLLKPDAYKITSQEKFDESVNYDDYLVQGDPWKTGGENVKNVVRQMNSLQEVYNLAKPYDHDVFLYLRPDHFYTPLDVDHIKELIKTPPHKKIIFDPDYARDIGGLNDRFYAGTAAAIDIVAQRGKKLRDFAKEHPLHAEKFFMHIVAENDIKFGNLGMWGVRVRATGEVEGRDAYLYKALKELFSNSQTKRKSFFSFY